MVNIPMPQNNTPTQSQPSPVSRPNDTSGLNIDEFVKIWDPETQETILEKRA